MELPPLVIHERDREFRLYSREQRENVVIGYLFGKLSNRDLDERMLGLDKEVSKGYQSMSILKHYGLTKDFKGIFKGKSREEALDLLPDNPQYDTIYGIISGAEVNEESVFDSGTQVFGYYTTVLQKIRVNQDKFRNSILSAYGGSCCVTGIAEPKLLRASHIKPWADSTAIEKTDVRNGLCLNALHDAAFDAGLITVEPSGFGIRLSPKIEDCMPQAIYDEYFRRYDGKQISLPSEEAYPNPEYLDYHRMHIFGKNRQGLKLEINLSE